MAVIELMIEKEFDQITIQDISDKADVSRRTIYLHYMDKFDLLDKLIEEHIDDLRNICESTDDDADYRDAGLLWFEYFESHSLFFSALLASKGTLFFRNRFLAFFLQELEKENNMSEGDNEGLADGVNVDIQFLGAAIVGVVEWWSRMGGLSLLPLWRGGWGHCLNGILMLIYACMKETSTKQHRVINE